MGAGSNCTKTAVNSSKKAVEIGADAILSVVPYYNKPNQQGMIEHFGEIAKNVDIPISLGVQALICSLQRLHSLQKSIQIL